MRKSFVILLMITLFAGCAKQSAGDKIHKRFYTMPSYRTNTEITVITDKTRNTYDIKALYDSSTGTYRLDFDDITVVVHKNHAQIKRGATISDTAVSDRSMLMLVNTFFESFYTCENAKVSSDITGDTVLTCDITNPPKYASKMKLRVDSKQIIPKKMEVYNKDDKQIMIVKFKEFEILKQVDPNEFNY